MAILIDSACRNLGTERKTPVTTEVVATHGSTLPISCTWIVSVILYIQVQVFTLMGKSQSALKSVAGLSLYWLKGPKKIEDLY